MINIPIHTKYMDTATPKDTLSDDILFSYTRKVKGVDDLAFFAQHQQRFSGERFYWKSPDDEMMISGAGILRPLFNSMADDRFKKIEEEWKGIIASSVIDNPYDIPGTGPLLFGGFSFDPYSIKEDIWQPYGDALFYLPEYMLTKYREDSYITVNLISDRKDKQTNLKRLEAKISKVIPPEQEFNFSPPEVEGEKAIAVDGWLKAVGDVVKDLKESPSLDKVVLSRKLQLDLSMPISSEFLLEQLKHQQPDSFIFLLENEKSVFTGASPERLVKKTGDRVLSASLAGSIGRDAVPEKDEEFGRCLLNDEKNLYEHALVVKMIKESLQSCCTSLQVPDEPQLLKTSYIQHLYTPVQGIAKPSSSIFRFVGSLHPTPALGGVPTKEAIDIIREKEKMDRGFYASPVGWTDYRDNGEFIVAIRSGLVKGKHAYLYAGCGLVADSVPEEELKETGIKLKPMLRAIGGD